MRLILLLIVSCLSVSQSVNAFEIQKLEDAEWTGNSSPFKCELLQNSSMSGSLRLIKEPKAELRMVFNPRFSDKVSNVVLSVEQSILRQTDEVTPELSWSGISNEYGTVRFQGNVSPALQQIATGNYFNLEYVDDSGKQLIQYQSLYGLRSVNGFNQCIEKMSPLAWKHAKKITLTFGVNQVDLTDSQQHTLSELKRFLSIDKKVIKILVDAHSDDSSNSLADRMLSQERADEVASELIGLGIDRNIIQVRAHGNRYPLQEGGKRLPNRRVMIRLVKDGK